MAFAPLDQRSQNEIAAMIGKLSVADQKRIVGAMRTIESVLGEAPAPQMPYLLRPPRPGDMGWIASRHGALYGEEYGWDERLEALTAEIVAAFVRNHDPKRERCWIAEREGENVGSVLLMRETPRLCALRARRATARSHSGPRACSPAPAASTSAPALRSSIKSRTTPSAKSSSARRGSWSCASSRPGADYQLICCRPRASGDP